MFIGLTTAAYTTFLDTIQNSIDRSTGKPLYYWCQNRNHSSKYRWLTSEELKQSQNHNYRKISYKEIVAIARDMIDNLTKNSKQKEITQHLLTHITKRKLAKRRFYSFSTTINFVNRFFNLRRMGIYLATDVAQEIIHYLANCPINEPEPQIYYEQLKVVHPNDQQSKTNIHTLQKLTRVFTSPSLSIFLSQPISIISEEILTKKSTPIARTTSFSYARPQVTPFSKPSLTTAASCVDLVEKPAQNDGVECPPASSFEKRRLMYDRSTKSSESFVSAKLQRQTSAIYGNNRHEEYKKNPSSCSDVVILSLLTNLKFFDSPATESTFVPLNPGFITTFLDYLRYLSGSFTIHLKTPAVHHFVKDCFRLGDTEMQNQLAKWLASEKTFNFDLLISCLQSFLFRQSGEGNGKGSHFAMLTLVNSYRISLYAAESSQTLHCPVFLDALDLLVSDPQNGVYFQFDETIEWITNLPNFDLEVFYMLTRQLVKKNLNPRLAHKNRDLLLKTYSKHPEWQEELKKDPKFTSLSSYLTDFNL